MYGRECWLDLLNVFNAFGLNHTGSSTFSRGTNDSNLALFRFAANFEGGLALSGLLSAAPLSTLSHSLPPSNFCPFLAIGTVIVVPFRMRPQFRTSLATFSTCHCNISHVVARF